MQSTYYITSHGHEWSVFVRDTGVLRLRSDLSTEAAALKEALRHARATGRHFNMSVFRIEPTGDLIPLYEQRPTS